MRKTYDLYGKSFTRWLAIKPFDMRGGRERWWCRCECGKEGAVEARFLENGSSRSCGCLRLAYEDIKGKRFGRWLVLNKSDSRNGQSSWLCICDCGNKSVVYLRALKTGESKSCGCLKKEVASRFHRRHGAVDTKEYRSWQHAKARCYNKNNEAYPNYGGRGIKMCDKWVEAFENFIADMGLAPSEKHSLDRFPDINGHYEPNNCRWATKKEQQNNRRNNHYITYNDETRTMTEWAEFLGENVKYFSEMIINKKMSIHQIVNRKRRKVAAKVKS